MKRLFAAALVAVGAVIGSCGLVHAQSIAPVILPSGCGTGNFAATNNGYPTIDPAGRLCNSSGGDISLATTPVVQNAAYSLGNAIGNLQTIPFFRNAGGSAILNNVAVWSKGGSTTAITIYIFTVNPTSSTCTDKSAFSLAAADISKLVAAIPPVLTPAVVGAGTTATTASQQSPISVKNGDSTVNLYVCAVVGGSVTPATTTDLVFDYAGVQD